MTQKCGKEGKVTSEEREIALHVIKKFSSVWEFDEEEEKAIDNIISELEQEPTTKNDLGVDCISRKAALDITWHDPSYSDPLNVLTEVRDKIRELPSVTPQEPLIVPIAEIKYDEDKLKELVSKCVLTVTPQEPTTKKMNDNEKAISILSKMLTDNPFRLSGDEVQAIRYAISSIETEHEYEQAIEKIRAEIDGLRKDALISWASSEMIIDTILEILDKYKVDKEQEDGTNKST